MLKLNINVKFTSLLPFEEGVAAIKQRDDIPRAGLLTFLSKQRGIRFIITFQDSTTMHFVQFQQSLSKYQPTHKLKIGGVVTEGVIKQNEDGTVEVEASSKVMFWDCILTSCSFFVLFGSYTMMIPLMLILGFGFAPILAILIGCLLLLGAILLWRFLIIKVRNDLINILKWTLHGVGLTSK